MDQVEQAVAAISKLACSEIKNLHTPASGISLVVLSCADFIEGRKGSNNWVSAKGKLYELLRRGVGTRDRVSNDQLSILRAFK